jgi:hypothetical protein
MKIEPRNYTQGPQAIYKNGTYRVIANYPEKSEAKLILNGVTKNISYDELFEVITESEANLRMLEEQAKEMNAKTNL